MLTDAYWASQFTLCEDENVSDALTPIHQVSVLLDAVLHPFALVYECVALVYEPDLWWLDAMGSFAKLFKDLSFLETPT